MKTIISLLFSVLFFSTSLAQNLPVKSKISMYPKTNPSHWVLDTILGYSGLGSSDWDYDQLEVVLSRNEKGLPLILELSEKIEGTATWVNVYHGEYSYFYNDTVDEYYVYEWNTQTNNWNSNATYYIDKEQDGRVIIEYERYWDNEYQYFYQGNKRIFSYDANDLIISYEDQDWYDNAWTQYLKTSFLYDENNNDTLELQQMYLGESQWRDNWKTHKIYDDQNKLIEELQEGYDSYYDEWFLYSKTTFSYYPDGKLQRQFTEGYDVDNEEWYDLSKSDYYYNDDELLWYIEEYDLETLDNSLKYEYTYNENLDETSFFLYSYNAKSWTLFYRVFDEYDENFNQTSFYSQLLDGTWQNFLKEEYLWNYYQTNVNKLDNNNVKIYPNPSSDIINIQVDNFQNATIFSLDGKKIITFNTKNVNIKNLNKGVYILKINASDKTSFTKILKN